MTLKKSLIGALVVVAVGLLVLSPFAVSAQTIGPTIPKPNDIFNGGLQDVGNNFNSVQDVVALIFKTIIALSGAIFLVLFLIGGLRYLLSSGDEEGTSKAKKVLVDSIIGLLAVLTAWAIGTWILGKVGLGPETSVNLATPTTPRPTGAGGGGTGSTTGGSGTIVVDKVCSAKYTATNLQLACDRGGVDGANDANKTRPKDTSRSGYKTKPEIDAYNYGYNQAYAQYEKEGTFKPQKPGSENYDVLPPISVITYKLTQSDVIQQIKDFTNRCINNVKNPGAEVKVDEGWVVTKFYCRGGSYRVN